MKCQKCGTEYEGNFCPNCGFKAEENKPTLTKKQCPKCGKIYEGNFCPNGCNSPFYNSEQAKKNRKNKKKSTAMGCLSAFLITIAVFIGVFLIIAIASEDTSGVESSGSSSSVSASSTVDDDTVKCNVGDTLNANGLKITYQKVEDWTSDNMFVEPKDGYKFIRAYFIMENTNSSDYTMGGWDFECYADNAKMDMSYYGDNTIDLYSTISSGRKLEGYIYFEVPTNASEIEIEYETNFWTDKKAIFKVK